MRVAALYDIHGHLPALEAVLAELERGQVDIVLAGGDAVSGPMPRETLERLVALGEHLHYIRGNTERELVARYGTEPDSDDVWARRAAWAADQLTAEQRSFLAALPEHDVLDVDGLGRTLFCHGSPRSDEEIITPLTSEERLREILAGVSEPVVVCGHTHVQFDRVVDGTRVVNAGSVGMPYQSRASAFWALLGPDVELRETPYDVERAEAAFRASGFPDAEEHVETVISSPPSAEEASEYFEQVAERG